MKKRIYKPSIAYRNQDNAEQNLLSKISILEELRSAIEASLAVGDKENAIHADFPKSIRQFNLWDSVKGPSYGISEVRRNSNETLRRYPSIRTRIEMTILSLNQIKQAIKRRGSNPERDLRMKLAESEKLRKILELELVKIIKERNEIAQDREIQLDRLAILQRSLKELSGAPHLVATPSRKKTPKA
ncbi:hypothetical protein [Herbaspirillum sp. YR522]|uniref:hypothetical protein n=1 Tax=Herbaspirillum sp. YR522 TaxID=1144342 RepID=UPI00026F6D56|nr:hypothetical protein [Herbaspirillum sp. YR522]EJN10132.1 hypothetical protein PMI40_00219 [Herbaspirillum sp. YR522]